MHAKTNTLTSQSPITLQDVIGFIREAPPQDFVKVRAIVRAVERHHLFAMRKCFKPGDEVEWEISKNAQLSEYFKGEVVAVNRSCCVVAVPTSEQPPAFQYYRVRFELLHDLAQGQACVPFLRESSTQG